MSLFYLGLGGQASAGLLYNVSNVWILGWDPLLVAAAKGENFKRRYEAKARDHDLWFVRMTTAAQKPVINGVETPISK